VMMHKDCQSRKVAQAQLLTVMRLQVSCAMCKRRWHCQSSQNSPPSTTCLHWTASVAATVTLHCARILKYPRMSWRQPWISSWSAARRARMHVRAPQTRPFVYVSHAPGC
jgi:hypothetical protein